MSNDKYKSDTFGAPDEERFEVGEGAVENNKPEPRRRASRAGTRSVATLTDAQLARKRANDREAQRSIRQRTKDRIEGLEQRIKELTDEQNDSRSLEDVQRRNSELEEELRRLRENMPNVENMRISNFPPPRTPPNMSPGGTALSTSFPTPSIHVFSPAGSNYSASNAGSPLSEMESASDYFGSVILKKGEPAAPINPTPVVHRPSFSGRPGVVRSVSYPDTRNQQTYSPVLPPNLMGIDEDFVLGGPSMVSGQQSIIPPLPVRGRPSMLASVPSSPSISGLPLGRMSSSFIDQQLAHANLTGGGYSQPVQTQAPTVTSLFSQPVVNPWDLPMRFLPSTGPIDYILLGIVDRQRILARNGATGSLVFGTLRPRLNGFVNPEEAAERFPIASNLCALIQHTAFRTLAEKAAALFITYRFCQWQINPSLETFNNFPYFFAPLSTQFLIPHPMWVSQLAWGALREIVVKEQERYATDEFCHIYGLSLNLNWPYRKVDILNFEGDEVTMTPAFEAYIMDFSNWSLDEPFQMRYPELRDACKFTGQRQTSQQ
ncbi:hypothetical protein LSUE1_G000983 [Lachnellula suecica]|uniref:BZIP transcription factor n=1 Tax=Lachnellula suecica TaxID=602035 RepID=A0A8T9CJR7_9HELO|nr:hypothetical protein LSUE1_G000983 [Lachnellula suecica]